MSRLPDRISRYGVEFRRWTPADVHLLDSVVSANIGHLRSRMAWIRFEPQPIEDRRRMLERWERNWLAGGDVHFAICRGEVVLGAAGLHRREADGLAIGYWVDRDHLHQGVATTAARALTDLGFTIPGIAWVDIHHDLSNVASRRVPEKLGYTRLADEQRTGDLPPADTGVGAVWRMARRQWKATQPGSAWAIARTAAMTGPGYSASIAG